MSISLEKILFWNSNVSKIIVCQFCVEGKVGHKSQESFMVFVFSIIKLNYRKN